MPFLVAQIFAPRVSADTLTLSSIFFWSMALVAAALFPTLKLPPSRPWQPVLPPRLPQLHQQDQQQQQQQQLHLPCYRFVSVPRLISVCDFTVSCVPPHLVQLNLCRSTFMHISSIFHITCVSFCPKHHAIHHMFSGTQGTGICFQWVDSKQSGSLATTAMFPDDNTVNNKVGDDDSRSSC